MLKAPAIAPKDAGFKGSCSCIFKFLVIFQGFFLPRLTNVVMWREMRTNHRWLIGRRRIRVRIDSKKFVPNLSTINWLGKLHIRHPSAINGLDL